MILTKFLDGFKKLLIFAFPFAGIVSHGVIGNTSGFGPEESRFEPWWDNKMLADKAGIFCIQGEKFIPTAKLVREPWWDNQILVDNKMGFFLT